MKAPRVTPIGLAAHRLGRELRALGPAVSLPDLHRALDAELKSEMTQGLRALGIAILLFFIAIQGSDGTYELRLSFIQMDVPVLYLSFFAASLIAGFSGAAINVALITAYRGRVARLIAGRGAGLGALSGALSGTASLGDVFSFGTTYLRTVPGYHRRLGAVYLLLLVPLALIYLIALQGLVALMGRVLLGAGQGFVDRAIAASGLLMLVFSLASLVCVMLPTRLTADRESLRYLLLFPIHRREGRLHPRSREWMAE